ncbi:hypothetical protein NMG60_11037209 [Bertholletia excelsa]
MDPRLYNLAKSEDVSLLKQLVIENPSLVLKLTPRRNTVLHIAARFGHGRIVAEIYKRQQSLITQQNLDGDTVLHVASRAGHLSIISFLVEELLSLSHGDIENRHDNGMGVLRIKNKANNTVLHEAVRNHHVRVVKYLVSVDPAVACSDNNLGESPLYLAARDGMLEIVNHMLMATPSSTHRVLNGQTALRAAIMEGHFDVAEALLKAKPQLIKEPDHQGRTPLHYAASSGDHRTARRLLQLDTDLAYMLDKEGQSVLHVAASKGHTCIIKEIIECSPDSGELLDLRGQNVLHIAVLNGHVNVVKYVLETTELEGLINQGDDEGNTPLHLATRERQAWIVHYLMWDWRVDRRAKNNLGQTAVDNNEFLAKLYSGSSRISNFWSEPWSLYRWITGEKISQEGVESKMQTYKQMGQTLLVVATLIATVTFAAAFTIPGGYSNDVGPNQGLALLQSTRGLKWFVLSDSIAMTCSITAACIIFWGTAVAQETYVFYFASATVLTYIALYSTALAFTSGLATVMPDEPLVHSMDIAVIWVFILNSCFFLGKAAGIFSFGQVCEFLIFQICKVRNKN